MTGTRTTETPDAATPASGPTAAIILAGGRASRLDGTAKPLLEVGGRTLLDRAIAAVDGCDPIVVVGPPAPTRVRVVWTRETPEFGGPVAGIAAGLALVDTAHVLLLAADLPNAEGAVALLHRHPPLSADADGKIGKADAPRTTGNDGKGGEDDDAPSTNGAHGIDGVCLIDASGRMQWLVGRYRTDALRSAAAALPDGGRDASLRSLLARLRISAIPAGDLATDVDTWDDLERARAAAPMPPRDGAPDEETT
ncbi:molybdenum cofactor guanylyltransferase [Microbacterium sp. CFBP9023]|uniref:molybdenum cofactor guanylyltransferase n=1 Tax=Microbacterium sp. CFBP9023 TaxID=3096535 RepID=UPI002A6990F8|nr:molybdenum cofactor guanylyltransferase [Microbacterium sp. CFBP9023]MDY0985071.1 molybdenum cofactor guanylyltransferase [Microbacterium sp. CFBP9023]